MTVKSGAQSGAVTLIQRFGSALNLDVHLHMLYLNGIYDTNGYFWPVALPTREELDVITHTIATRVSRYLEKAGYLVRDPEHGYLDLLPDDDEPGIAIAGRHVSRRDLAQPIDDIQGMQVARVQDAVGGVECVEHLGPEFLDEPDMWVSAIKPIFMVTGSGN